MFFLKKKSGDFPSRICCDSFRTALLLEKLLLHTFSESLLRHNSYFFGAAISSGQLLFLRSFFFRKATYLQQLFFFQNNYFFRVKLLSSSHFLRMGNSLGSLLFGTATFLAKDLFTIKISIEELLFRSGYFCTESIFSEEQHENRKKPVFQ